MSRTIHYSDNFQTQYTYTLTASVGRSFDPLFRPDLTPREMFTLGVFGGAYFVGVEGGVPDDLPQSWFTHARLAPDGIPHKQYNYFHVNASQSLEVWREKGWIHHDDPHGWFQWYCRYYLGRRMPEEDLRQIKRWYAMRRHATQIMNHCERGALHCRPRQRQALLHWAYDSRKW